MLLNHDSPASIRRFLDARNLAPRKRWGQNFLINRGAREKILKILDINPNQWIWEIGPGLGAMSVAILQAQAMLTAFEIDPAYCVWLREYLGPLGIRIVEGDVAVNWKREWSTRQPDRIIGNLPYNAASTIIASFLENKRMASKSVFMVQDEMSKRMTAELGGKNYSYFSVLCQTECRINDGGRLSPGSFHPAPQCNSRIIIMEPVQPHGEIDDPILLHLLVKVLFKARRKTLANSINSIAGLPGFPPVEKVRNAFEEAGVELHRRPETVHPEQWVHIANCASKK